MVSEISNQQDFDLCVSVVLQKLYESFPVPIILNPDALQEQDDPDRKLVTGRDLYLYAEQHGLEPNTSLIDVYRWSIRFLEDEEIIRDIKREDDDLMAARLGPGKVKARRGLGKHVLTSKGFALLNTVPKSIDGPPRSIIENIQNAAKKGTAEVLGKSITQLVTSAAMMFATGN